jgi:hypothetical protein
MQLLGSVAVTMHPVMSDRRAILTAKPLKDDKAQAKVYDFHLRLQGTLELIRQ